MKILLYIFGGFLMICIIVVLMLPLVLPKSLDITVNSEIDAPKAWTFDQFNNLKNQVQFNAFLLQDSALGKQFLSPYEGKNANFKWVSNMPEVGRGDILITESKSDTIKTLVSLNTFNTSFQETIIFNPSDSDNKSSVTWHRKGNEVPYFQRYLLWLNKENNVSEISNSLALLEQKSTSESFNKNSDEVKIGSFQKTFVEGAKLVYNEYEDKIGNKSVNIAAQRDFKTIQNFFSELDAKKLSKPVTFVAKWDTVQDKSVLDFGYFVFDEIEDRPKDSNFKSIPSTNAITYTIQGNYRNIDSLYYALGDYISSIGATSKPYFWVEELSANSTKDTLVLRAYQSIE